MASSTYCLCSSRLVNGVTARDLSSSAAFVSGSPISCCPPTPKSSSKLYTTKCSFSEEEQQSASVVKRVLTGVVATGAALAVFTNMAIAAQGPGNEGGRRVAEKADKLLKAADKLNIEDAPPRFGPGRPGGAEDPTKISQQAGSGAAASVKESVSDATKGVSDAAKKVQNKSGGSFGLPSDATKGVSDAAKKVQSTIGGSFGSPSDATKGVSDAAKKVQNKSGGFFGFGKKQSSAVGDSAKDAVSQAKGKTDEVVRSVRQAINRDGLGRFRVPKDIASNVEGAVGQAQTKQSQIANSAKDAVGQAQSKANLGNSGGNVLSSLQEGLQGLKENATQSTEDAKNTVQKTFK